MKNELFTLAVFTIIFLIIGLSCLFSGCNPNSNIPCSTVTKFNGIVTKKVIDIETCTRCAQYNSKHHCVRHESYTCYNAYVYAYKTNNTNNNNYCHLQTANGDKSETSAINSYKKYDVGDNVNWYKKNNTKTCITANELFTIWIVGVVFLALC